MEFVSSLDNQFASINGYDSGLAAINCGVHQGSITESLPFCYI